MEHFKTGELKDVGDEIELGTLSKYSKYQAGWQAGPRGKMLEVKRYVGTWLT